MPSSPLHVKTIAPADATGAVKDFYFRPHPLKPPGTDVVRYVQAWGLQVEVAESWLHHGELARHASGIDSRQYEVLCVRVAYNFRCAYVLRNHSFHLHRQGRYTPDEVFQISHNWTEAGLDEKDRAMLAFADKMCARSDEIHHADVDALRIAGFQEPEIVALIMLIGWRISDAVNGNAFGLGDGDDYSSEMQSVIDWK